MISVRYIAVIYAQVRFISFQILFSTLIGLKVRFGIKKVKKYGK